METTLNFSKLPDEPLRMPDEPFSQPDTRNGVNELDKIRQYSNTEPPQAQNQQENLPDREPLQNLTTEKEYLPEPIEKKQSLMNINENQAETVEVRSYHEEMSQVDNVNAYGSNMKKTRLKSGLRKSKIRNTATKSLKSAGKVAAYGEVFIQPNISPIK